VLFQPILWTSLWLIKKPEIGEGRSKSDKRNGYHQNLINQYTLNGAIQCGKNEQGLKRHVSPFPHGGAIMLMLNTKPSIPREIDRKDAEEKHHPAENAANKFGIKLASQMRMGW